MGRIADAALDLLSQGPVPINQLAQELGARGVTRARDPRAALARAIRAEPRLVVTPDGRVLDRIVAGRNLVLTTRIDEASRRAGGLVVGPELAPARSGGTCTVALDPALAVGDVVAIMVGPTDGIALRRVAAVAPSPQVEAALIDLLCAALIRPPGAAQRRRAVSLAAAVLTVAADDDRAFRTAGQPLAELLADSDLHLEDGWVVEDPARHGPADADRLDELQALAGISLAGEDPGRAIPALRRAVVMTQRPGSGDAGTARRRLARTLARVGRVDEGLTLLIDGPRPSVDDWYEAATIALRSGDEPHARRCVQTGLAHHRGSPDDPAALCLDDLGGDMDAQARFVRVRDDVQDMGSRAEDAERLAAHIARLSRSYLVEALVEEVVDILAPSEVVALAGHLAEADGGHDACLALGMVLPRQQTRHAFGGAMPAGMPRSPSVAGLVAGRLDRAWVTDSADAPDQRQLVVTVAKEADRVSPLVVLIDLVEMGGAVKDAFFLPDMLDLRLEREILAPMGELGLPCRPIGLAQALATIATGLERTRRLNWRIPSLLHQPVVDRIDRWLLHPRVAGNS